MPAPVKQGLDYWPRSVNLCKDPKLRIPKMKYGYLAVMIYELLLDLLYMDKGYYIDYSRKEDVIWTLMEGLQGKYQPTYEAIAEVIECLVACELFSGDQFKYKNITSIRAQRTYYSATVDRKMVNINYDIWMLTEAEMLALSSKSAILANFQARANNRVNRMNNEVNRPVYTQSKVKESKVNNIRSYAPQADADGEHTTPQEASGTKTALNEIWTGYAFSPSLKAAVFDWIKYKTELRQNYKPQGLRGLLAQIKNSAEKYGDTAVIEVIRASMANGYKGITWDKIGSQATTAAPRQKSKFADYGGRDYTPDELDRLEKLALDYAKNAGDDAGNQ